MIEITTAALRLGAAINRTDTATAALHAFYADWKQAKGLGFIERHSSDWQDMLEASTSAYMERQRAKSCERYWRKRLALAVAREGLK